jgi:DNA processing protein
MDDDRLARLALSRLCEPGSWPLHDAVGRLGALAVWDALVAGQAPPPVSPAAAAGAHTRAQGHDVMADVRRLDRLGVRLVTPQDDEWPLGRLDWDRDQKAAPPLALFLRGAARLDAVTERSVSVVGARATTAYGALVAGELGLGIADRGWTVVSGGAYGIDGAAHRGALDSTGGTTVAVLACSVDVAYPRGHSDLLDRIAREGLLVSEHPPGSAPTRSRFLVRNRLIAALSVGTVVVEDALRSGSLTTAGQAATLGRHLMAVPGPVTSAMSTGAHRLLRNGAVCVTSAAEVLDTVGALGVDAAPESRGPVSPRDALSDVVRQVLDAIPVRSWAGPASIAKAAGVSPLIVQQVLPPLQVAGLVEESLSGWRLTPLGAGRPAKQAG